MDRAQGSVVEQLAMEFDHGRMQGTVEWLDVVTLRPSLISFVRKIVGGIFRVG